MQCTPKQTLLLPPQHILATPDDQFIFSFSWLPSPRFELRTLAGYTTLASGLASVNILHDSKTKTLNFFCPQLNLNPRIPQELAKYCSSCRIQQRTVWHRLTDRRYKAKTNSRYTCWKCSYCAELQSNIVITSFCFFCFSEHKRLSGR